MKEKIKELIRKLKTIKTKTVYRIKKKICSLMYDRITYIPEKETFVATIVFPTNITDDIRGVTDVFKGSKKKIEYLIPLYTEYIRKISLSGNVHKNVVRRVKSGEIPTEGILIF